MSKAENLRFHPVRLRAMRVQIGALSQDCLQKMLDNLADFFKGEKLILDLGGVPLGENVDLNAIKKAFAAADIALLGVSNVAAENAALFQNAGFIIFGDEDFAPDLTAPAPQENELTQAPALLVEAPVRSGMEYYNEGDVVVLGRVNAGAQIFAEGNIVVCGVLKGKAMAGGAAKKKARIFTADMQAELVSIAGVFQKFENGVDEKLRGKPVCISLQTDGDLEWLKIELL